MISHDPTFEIQKADNCSVVDFDGSEFNCEAATEPRPEIQSVGPELIREASLDSGIAIQRAASCSAVGLDGSSGHSTFRRWRFAFAAYGPFTAALVIFFARDMYILKLGADTNRIGIIATVWSIGFPIAYLVSGHVMEQDWSLFTRPGWGRRAPWFMTHIFPLALSVFFIFIPGLFWIPAPGSKLLDAWLVACLLISSWCLPVLLNAIESARAEIYPFKEERVIIEAMTKFVGVFAASSGILPQMVLWINARLSVRFAVSLFLLLCISTSIEAVPVLRDARQPNTDTERATFGECFTLLRNSPMFHASFVRFWHSAADATYLSISVYYVTFVDGFDSTDRAKWGLIAGVIIAGLEFLVLVPFWAFVWSNRTVSASMPCGKFLEFLSNSMQGTCCTLHVLGALFPPVFLRLLPEIGMSQPWEWITYSVIFRFFYSPQAFFRTVSFCWAVDDDCHRQSCRREALHSGVAKFFEDEGRALAFVVFLGVGWAGLETENCELICEEAISRKDCVSACDRRDINRQPEAVREYIKFVLTFLVPIFGLLCALHIWLFPVHGERLQELQETQASTFKKVRPEGAECALGCGGQLVNIPGEKARFGTDKEKSTKELQDGKPSKEKPVRSRSKDKAVRSSSSVESHTKVAWGPPDCEFSGAAIPTKF